jgi:hypothetical protein
MYMKQRKDSRNSSGVHLYGGLPVGKFLPLDFSYTMLEVK